MFCGRIDKLEWDPGRLFWPRRNVLSPFMSFLARIGRDLLQQRYVAPSVIERKWQGVLPLNYRLRWSLIWAKGRTPKEVGLLWLVWHKVVAVNM